MSNYKLVNPWKCPNCGTTCIWQVTMLRHKQACQLIGISPRQLGMLYDNYDKPISSEDLSRLISSNLAPGEIKLSKYMVLKYLGRMAKEYRLGRRPISKKLVEVTQAVWAEPSPTLVPLDYAALALKYNRPIDKLYEDDPHQVWLEETGKVARLRMLPPSGDRSMTGNAGAMCAA